MKKNFSSLEKAKQFVLECSSNAGCICDNRFAVISSVHFDLTEYDNCNNDSEQLDLTASKDDEFYYAVVTVYSAEDCSNLSYAESDKHMSNIEEIHVFTTLEEANELFRTAVNEKLKTF